MTDSTASMSKIDTHQHFWRYNPEEYGWIDDDMASLRRDFLPVDLAKEIAQADVDGVVAVQARQTVAETDWLLELAEEHDFIRGVVGWAPIASPGFAEWLSESAHRPKLRGLRHVVQGEPDGFLLRDDFHAGIAALRGTSLVYDILIFERQLPEAIEFADRHPDEVFVLDHIAKPRIRHKELSPWGENIRELALRQNVYCKLSGMTTEADWRGWTATDLKPYAETVLEAFGAKRLMAGSDWPVCTVACGYKQWFETVAELIDDLSQDEREHILGGTAIEAYGLKGNG